MHKYTSAIRSEVFVQALSSFDLDAICNEEIPPTSLWFRNLQNKTSK